MTVQDIPLFPVQIRKIDNFLSSEDIQKIIKIWRTNLCKQDNVRKPEWGINGEAASTYPSYGTARYTNIQSTLHDIDKLLPEIRLLERLKEETDSYTDFIGYQKTYITSSWVNVQYRNSELLRHIHPLSVVSGVIYFQTDHLSSEICFYHPNQLHTWHTTESEGLVVTSKNTYPVQPNTGMLILFPGWLEHGGAVNRGNERMICSFDTAPLTYKVGH